MMRKEIKTAIIGAIIIVAAIGGIGVFLTSLDKTVANTGNQTIVDNTIQNTNNTGTKSVVYPDENNYPLAPNLTGITGYINTTPEELQAKMKDKVVLYDFWTYTLYKLYQNFTISKSWNEKYADKGLLIIGVHSPEFEFEKDINNVKMAAQKYNITYPIVLDSDHQDMECVFK